MNSVVSGIPPAEAGAWPSSTRLVSKIKPNEDGHEEVGLRNKERKEPPAAEKLLTAVVFFANI